MMNMNLVAVVTPPSIYHGYPLGRRSGKKLSHVSKRSHLVSS